MKNGPDRRAALWGLAAGTAGVTWRSEALFQEQAGNPIEHIDIPAAPNTTGIYAGAVVRGAAHADAAKKWLAFLKSPDAVMVFESYGLKAYTP